NSTNFGNLTLIGANGVNVHGAINVVNGGFNVPSPFFFSGGTITTTGNQNIGPMTMGAHTTLNGANITLVNVNGSGFNLTLNANAIAALTGALINVNNLISMGTGITLINTPTIEALALINILNLLYLAENVVFNAPTINFMGGINGNGHDLTANGNIVTFSGNANNLGALTSNANLTRIGGNLFTSRGMTFGNDVRLIGNSQLHDSSAQGINFAGAVDGTFALLVNATNGGVRFGGRVGGDTPLSSLAVNAGDGAVILFDTDLVRVVNNILLNVGQPIPSNHTLATIAGTGDLTFISTNGEFRMGQNQKMTVLGNLVVQALKAVLGDVNTVGDMTFTANTIEILLRPSVPGFDQGVDFVSGGRMFFSVTPILVGDGPAPQFSNPRGDLDALGTLSGFVIRAFGDELGDAATATNLLFENGVFLDLQARGPTIVDLSSALAAEVPQASETEEVEDDAQLPASIRRELEQQVGLYLRDLSGEELADLAQGRGIYLDIMPSNVSDNLGLHRIVVARLDRTEAINTIARWRALRFAADENGNMVERSQLVKSRLSDFWDMYADEAADAGEPLNAAGFGAFLNDLASEDESAQAAADDMRMLRDFVQGLMAMGTTSNEARTSAIRTAYMEFGPTNASPGDLHEAVLSMP
ncbi:MAG TPA: hypothetical protein PK400_12120, partial [Phycisphaerales bacterium]|nr:hypothetical protein [Phycisphaerales bacterium]